MRKLINNIIKALIITSVKSNATWPLVYIYSKVIREVKSTQNRSNAKKFTLLVLTPERFRGDLKVLADTNKFRILSLPCNWQYKIISLYWSEKIEKKIGKYWDPGEDRILIKMQSNLRSFLKIFLASLYSYLNIDAVVSACVYYRQDHDWGLVSHEIGIPYIVLHRENLATATQQKLFYLNKFREIKRFNVDYIIVQNLQIKELLIKSGIVNVDKVDALGCLRMCDYVRRLKGWKKNDKKRRKVVLFSFHYGAGLQTIRGSGFINRDIGYVELFEHVHVSIARLASQHGDIDFVIKPKWGGPWIDEIEYVFRKNNIDSKDFDNLSILVDVNVHELILEADVICGFGSTTLLEAAIANVPVIVPYFADALKPEYAEHIQFKEEFEIFDIAHSVDDFEKLIIERLKNPKVSKECMDKRYSIFEKYVSSMKGDAVDKYVRKISHVIEGNNFRRVAKSKISF